jgi:hypothetical protein
MPGVTEDSSTEAFANFIASALSAATDQFAEVLSLAGFKDDFVEKVSLGAALGAADAFGKVIDAHIAAEADQVESD